MKINKYILIIFSLLILQSCGKEKAEDKNVSGKKETIQPDTSSVRIEYSLTGKSSGVIVISKKGNSARIDLSKAVSDSLNANESRFVYNGYLYSFYSTVQGIRPVKQLIIKDHSYHKNFSSFIEANEFISNMQSKGTEQIAGQQCNIYTYPQDGSMFWIYGNKYVLKAAFDGATIQAIKFEQNITLDSNKILPPKDINFQEIGG